VTIEVFAATVDYLRWSKADPDHCVTRVIMKLVEYVCDLDRHHEEYFMQRRRHRNMDGSGLTSV